MRPRTRSIWAALVVGALTVLGLAAAPTAALAAGNYATQATVSDIKFTKTEITDDRRSELTGSWSLPDNPTTPAGFTLELPAELKGLNDSFNLVVPGTSEVMGKCVVTTTELDCSIDDAYVAKNPRNLHGTFNFWASSQLKNTETVVHDFTFKNVVGKTTVTVKPDKCTERCEFTGWSGQKFGSYDPKHNEIWWYIEVPAPVGGLTAGEDIVVSDILGDGQALAKSENLWVEETSTVVKHDSGSSYPDDWKTMDASRLAFSAGPPITASWKAEQGKFYRVVVRVSATKNLPTYTNKASIKVGSTKLVDVSSTIDKQGGSGTGLGNDVGMFTINKKVNGDAIVPTDAKFTVHYVVTGPDGKVLADADTTVSATEPFRSEVYPVGSTVKLSEAKPEDSASVSWAAPVFDKAEFTLEGGTNTEVALTNTATLQTGDFKVKKVLSGNGASLISADHEFTVKYNYAAGDGYAAGSGELKVRADGTEATSPKLPVGAVVKLSEVAPAPVDKGTWGEAKFSTDTVTIAKGESVEVTLENPITTVPPTSTTPSTPTTPTTPETTPAEPTPVTTPPTSPPLANTGASVGFGVGAAALLLIAGVAAVGFSRRRARH